MLLRLERADVIMDRVFSRGESLHAPGLLDLEVTQVVRKYWRTGDITGSRGQQAIADLGDLPIQRHSHEPLLARIWQLRHNVTAYDAAYIALAEGLRAEFLTLDAALARVPGVRLRVEVL